MVNNKTIMRSILIMSYLLLIALIVYGVSAVFVYLNTGADRSKMLHTEIKKTNHYLPTTAWGSLENEGRKMDNFTLKSIETDYLDAWYVMHLAYKNNSTIGIDDYFTKQSRKPIYQLIKENKKANVHIESTTFEHNPKLEFFSEDGQLVSITDENVVEYKRVFKNDTIIIETQTVSTYKAIMLLEDGFWRIRHFVKTETKPFKNTIEQVEIGVDIKGVNYYPKDTPWDMFGDKFNIEIIENDFKIIKDAGLNTIRIFIQYNDFGAAAVNKEKIIKLKQLLTQANRSGIRVIITLFDFYGDYSVIDWTLNQKHVEQIVNAVKMEPALLAWDIKNEPDLDFESRGKKQVIAWLNNTINTIKKIDNINGITIGWYDPESASILADKVDFVSFHYYKDITKLDSVYKSLKQTIPDKQIVLGEYGVSSYKGIWNAFTKSKTKQAEYHKTMQQIITSNSIPYISWTLYDFENIPTSVIGRLPWRRSPQKKYGFIDNDGEEKPSFQYISTKSKKE